MTIQYTRTSVCAQDDYVNHAIAIKLPKNATVKDLVDYICHYHDENGYDAVPFTGGNAKWGLVANGRTIAEVYDDTERIHYYGADNPLRTLKITEVQGKRLS